MTANIFRLLALVLLILSCSSPLAIAGSSNFQHVVPPRTQNLKADCLTEKTYSYEYEQVGYYRDYKTVIHSQIPFHRHHFTAEDMSRINKYIEVEAQKKFKRQVPETWRWRALRQMLQKTHVILVKDDPHLKQIMGPDDDRLLAQMSRSTHTCFRPVNDTWFFVVVDKAFRNKDADTVVHEAMHIVSRVLFDDWQSDHNSPRFWSEEGPNSLQGAVVEVWELSAMLRAHSRMPWLL